MRLISLFFLAPINLLGAVGSFLADGGSGIGFKSEPSMQFTNTISISVWAKLIRNAPNFDTTDMPLVTKQNSLQTDSHFTFKRGVSGQNLNGIDFYFLNGASAFQYGVSGQTPFTITNVWKHYGVTFSYGLGSQIKFYIDGVAFSGSWLVGSGNFAGVTNASNGKLVSGNPAGWLFNGYMTEVAIWNAILTPIEMKNLAKGKVKRTPLQIRPNDLIAYWPLDSLKATTSATTTNLFRNLARNENHGTPDSTGLKGVAESVLSYPPNE